MSGRKSLSLIHFSHHDSYYVTIRVTVQYECCFLLSLLKNHECVGIFFFFKM